MCHVANRSDAARCDDCGYEFGQSIETLRGLLRGQYRRWAVALATLVIVDVALLGAIAYLAAFMRAAIIPALALVASLRGTITAARKIGITRHSLKLIGAKEAALPKATLLRSLPRGADATTESQ